MKKIIIMIVIVFGIIFVSSCSSYQGDIQKVGMLTETPIDGLPWEEKGYDGLQQIGKKFGVDVFLKEGIQTELEVGEAVDEMVHRGVNLIFGHSSNYGRYFVDLANAYPDVHFVYFNGGYSGEQVTSLNLQTNAMAFFAGMIAGKMTTSNQVGIIASYEWQSEIEGFYEGVKYQNPTAKVHINYVENGNVTDGAMEIYDKMRGQYVDVFYPIGDSFSADVIKRASADTKYTIGHMTDQSDIDPEAVLTSTVQQVDKLYITIAEKFNKGSLDGGVVKLDFADKFITLGEFNKDIPKDFQQLINDAVDEYIDSGLLPYEHP